MRSCLEISDLNCAVEDAETIFCGLIITRSVLCFKINVFDSL